MAIDADLQEAGELIAIEMARMTTILSAALTLEWDSDLRTLLRVANYLKEDDALVISHPKSQVWMEIGVDGRVVLHRRCPVDTKCIEFDEERFHLGGIQGPLAESIKNSGARVAAMSLLMPLIRDTSLPTRTEFNGLARWAPLIEHKAYLLATRILAFLDKLRRHTRSQISTPTQISTLTKKYWALAHSAACLILLASDRAAGIWLGDMAHSFPWSSWTPSFSLLRERTVWLAAAGARSTMSCGAKVVEPYVKALARTKVPLKAFDALFGLAAIALSDPGLSKSVRAEIAALKHHAVSSADAEADYVELMFLDALWAIDRQATDQIDSPRELGWKMDAAGFATAVALRSDPASLASSGHYFGFSILSSLVQHKSDYHFSVGQIRGAAWPTSKQIIGIIERTWQPSQQLDSARLH